MTDTSDRLSAALSGRYRIERELGAGGMATVYLAEDLKHDRKVAIKVLKPELAAVLGAERFVVEIKTTAAMSHPHILPLFDSGTADGFLFYVMPYIEGETIREKLNRETQFGVDEAVRIAREVADALDYAHRHGVIHRDIKPENILLHDGRAMVMDFGIALAVSAAAGGRMTETGLSLGTPHYMSPEQATAEKEITARSDQYSLASVLYEMLAGQPPHIGGSAQAIIMKIIAEPVQAVTQLRKSVPPNVAFALAKALEKVPADRFQTAKKFADALQSPLYGLESRTGVQVPSSGSPAARVVRFVPWLVAATAVLLAAVLQLVQSERPNELLHLELAPPVGSEFAEYDFAALSPDGSRLAFVAIRRTGRRLLWIRDLRTGRLDSLASTTGAAAPFWSPDGKSLGYFAGGALWRIEADGNASRRLCETPDLHGAWNEGGIIIFTVLGRPAMVSAASGTCRPIAGYWADSANRIRRVEWLPDGHHFAGRQGPGIIVSDTTGSTPSRLLPSGTDVRFVAPDIAVFTSSSASGGADLAAQHFDRSTFAMRGSPVTLAKSVRTASGIASYAANASLIVYLGDFFDEKYQVLDQHGVIVDSIIKQRTWTFQRARSRPLVAMGGLGLWLHDLDRHTTVSLNSNARGDLFPVWSPGDSLLAVSGTLGITLAAGDTGQRRCTASIIRVSDPSDRTDVKQPGGALCLRAVSDWTADGRFLIIAASPPDAPNRSAIWTYELATARFEKLYGVAGGAVSSGVVSPDGRWLAFVSDETGELEVYLRPFHSNATPVRVSVAGGGSPRWSRDGRWLYFVTPDGVMSRVSVSSGNGQQFGLPERLFRAPDWTLRLFADQTDGMQATTLFNVSADGQRFFMQRRVRPFTAANIVTGWQVLMSGAAGKR